MSYVNAVRILCAVLFHNVHVSLSLSQVSLPNGARVEVFIATPPSVQNFLNVRMNPGMGDRGQISGLVGNYNGNAGDDMAGPDGNMIGAGNAFGRAWR